MPVLIQDEMSKKLSNHLDHTFVSIYSSFTHGQDVTVALHLMEWVGNFRVEISELVGPYLLNRLSIVTDRSSVGL